MDAIGKAPVSEVQVPAERICSEAGASEPEVAAIFEDIMTKGAKFPDPDLGFFAHDPELLTHWWGLQKRLQKIAGEVPKKIMFGITFVCATEVGCPRCINNAQVHLQEQFDLTDEEILELSDFELSKVIPEKEKAVSTASARRWRSTSRPLSPTSRRYGPPATAIGRSWR